MKLFKKKKIMKQFESAKDLGEMGRVLAENDVISAPKDNHHNVFGESIDHLDEDGELPFGWIAHNQKIISQIDSEVSTFRKAVCDANEVRCEYAALKSYFRFLEDGQKRYSEVGECAGKYFEEYIVDSQESQSKSKRLAYLEKHLEDLIAEERIQKNMEQNLLPHLREDLLKIIEDNPGILQTDVYKRFEPESKDYLSSELYFMAKDGLIHRKKQGRSYALSL